LVTRAVLNSIAIEADRVRAAAQTIEEASVLSMVGSTPTYATPTPDNVTDAINLVFDPQNHLATWDAWQSSYTSHFALSVELDDVPPICSRATLAVADGSGTARLRVPFTSTDAGNYYAYLLLKADAGRALTVSFYAGASQVGTATTVAANTTTGWTVVRCSGSLAADTVHTIDVNAGSAPAGYSLRMTGVTVSPLADPGEPFDGDRGLDGYLYEWSSAAHASPSFRHNGVRDFLAMREESAQLSPAPYGLTTEQRRSYLLARFRARNRAWASMFVDLIVALIQSENPDFSESGVRVTDDPVASTMAVEIAYSPSGRLVDRVTQLVAATKPLHIGLPAGIVWGAFLAGPDMLETTLAGAQNIDGPAATANVASSAGWPASGYFEVNGTQYSYSGTGSGTFTGVARLTSAPTGWDGVWSNGAGGSQADASLVRQIIYAYGQAGEPL
jgi:hypothetical protein